MPESARKRRHAAPGGMRGGSRRRDGRWAGVLTALLATCSAFLAGELILRWSDLAPDPGLFTVTEREYARVPGIFGPNQDVVQARGTRFEHRVSINALGYRGADFPRVKSAGEARILFVGDSFTWGHNVEDDETLPAQLEAVLTARCGGTLTVANGGLSGSSILGQEVMIQRGLVIDPDLVVLMYHENDIDELIHTRIWEQLAANRRVKSRPPLSLVYPLVRTTATWNLALHVRRLMMLEGEEASLDPREDGEGTTSAVVAARDEYAQRLASITDRLDAVRIPIVFVMYPHPGSVNAGVGGRDYDWIRAAATDLRIPTVDLLPHLAATDAPIDRLYLVPDDYHPSPEGYALAATTLTDLILERSLLPCRT